jgi:nitrate reductase NapE component
VVGREKVRKRSALIGLLFVGLVIRAILGAAIVVAVVFLAWKLGKVADAYATKTEAKQ